MKVLVWGCGNMASAVARGLKLALPELELICWNPTEAKAQRLASELQGSVLIDAENIQADVVLLGFKPQMLPAAAPDLAGRLSAKTIVVSMLAAVTIEGLRKHFSQNPIVRIMPNLAVERRDGVVLWESSAVSLVCDTWWEKLGLAAHVNEEQIDLYTLHAGSSPAFLYYWIEAASKFAALNGGDAALAQKILIKAWQGALHGLENETSSMNDKIKAVASKGGVTQAALDKWAEISPDYIQQGLSAGLKRIQQMKS